MDGATAARGTDASRRLHGHYQVGTHPNAQSLHEGLFEQILSLHVPLPSTLRPEREAEADTDELQPARPVGDEGAAQKPAAESPRAQPEDHAREETSAEQGGLTVSLEISKPIATGLPAEPQQSHLEPDVSEAVPPEPAQILTTRKPEIEASEGIEALRHRRQGTKEETLHTIQPHPEGPVVQPKGEDKTHAVTVDEAPEHAENHVAGQHSTRHMRQPTGQATEESAGEVTVEATEEATPLQLSGESTDSAEVDQQSSSSKEQREPLTTATASSTDDAPQDQQPHRRVPREKWYQQNESEPAPQQAVNPSDNSIRPAEHARSNGHQNPVPLPSGLPPQPALATAEAALPAGDTVQPQPALVGTSPIVAAATDTRTGTVSTNASPSTATTAAESGPRLADRRHETPAPGKSQASDVAAELTQQERVRLIQRVSRSFARLGATGGSIALRLHPPQLGTLNVQVRIEGRSMTAKLTTESAAAREAILESLPVLRSRLAEQGFEISQFQVEVADSSTDASGGHNRQPNSFDQPADRRPPTHWSSNNEHRASKATSEPVRRSADTALNWHNHNGIDVHA